MRQMIEDELRRAGAKLRDLDVRLELGLQESVTSAVRGGYGVTFISRSSVENELAAGTLVDASGRRARARARRPARPRHRPLRDARGARLRRLRARAAAVIVRWSLAELPDVLAEVGIERPFLIASRALVGLELPRTSVGLDEVPSERRRGAGRGRRDPRRRRRLGDRHGQVRVGAEGLAGRARADHLLRRRVDDRATASASPDRIIRGHGGGAHPVAIVYDVDLTLELPTGSDGRHGAERASPTAPRRSTCRDARPDGDEQALAGAALISACAAARARRSGATARACVELLQGAAHGGHALGLAGLALAHAMAQALGGTYGLPHGAMNALCLPPALAFNRQIAPDEVARFGAGDRRRRRSSAHASSHCSAASTGCATSACRRPTCPRSADAAAKRRRQPRQPRPASPPRSWSCSPRSGEGSDDEGCPGCPCGRPLASVATGIRKGRTP